MIIYNITVKPDAAIAAAWLQWLQQTHGLDILNTGCFYQFRVMQLMEIDNSEGPTYAVQFYAHSMAHYHRYLKEHAAIMQQKEAARWGQQIVAFSTVMQQVV